MRERFFKVFELIKPVSWFRRTVVDGRTETPMRVAENLNS